MLHDILIHLWIRNCDIENEWNQTFNFSDISTSQYTLIDCKTQISDRGGYYCNWKTEIQIAIVSIKQKAGVLITANGINSHKDVAWEVDCVDLLHLWPGHPFEIYDKNLWKVH